MQVTSIAEASEHLSELIARVEAGEEVLIGRDGRPVAKLVAVTTNKQPREGGQWKGRVKIADDFDELPPDIRKAFGMDPE